MHATSAIRSWAVLSRCHIDRSEWLTGDGSWVTQPSSSRCITGSATL
jgi:hypothetical protein